MDAHWRAVNLTRIATNHGWQPGVNTIGQISCTGCPGQTGTICAFLQTLKPMPLASPSSLAQQFFNQHCLFRVKNSGNHLSRRYPKYKSRSPMSSHIQKPQYEDSLRQSLYPSKFQTWLKVTKVLISLHRIHNGELLKKTFSEAFPSLTGLKLQVLQSAIMTYFGKLKFN